MRFFFKKNVIIPPGIGLAVRPFFHLPSGSSMQSDIGFKAALAEAKKGDEEGGVPIGAALVSADGKVLGRGHNMRLQKGSATLHVSCYGFTAAFVIFPFSLDLTFVALGRDFSARECWEIACFCI